MESWSYVVSGDKFCVSDDFASETDEIARIRNGMTAWGLKPSGIGSNSFLSSNPDLDESGSSDVMKNSVANGSIRDVLSGKFQFPGEEESCSKPSSTIVESSSRDSSSLIDLKLGRFPDLQDVNFSKTESSSMTMMPAKKARGGSLSCQRPFCQVHGCRKDLSSSKDYHKRHKVCEIHSKTTKVIVNGIEQRFCQQCSRFHLLAEFDDGKRSCRKRLAGHNERRRKPHTGMHASRAGRVFQSYSGSRLERSSSVLSSFVCEDLLPQKYEMNQWSKTLKVEDGFPNSNPMNPQKYNNHHHPLVQNVSSSSDFDSPHHHHPLFHSPASANPIGNGDLTVLDSSSTNTSYGCALSLLSSQSHNSSIPSSGLGIGVGVPFITNAPSRNAHYSITQVSEKLMRVSPQTSTTAGMEPILIPDGGDSVSYGISGIIPGSEFMNGKNQLSCEDGSTIDLLQLSSQLQRVEHERQSIKVEEDSGAFFGLRIT